MNYATIKHYDIANGPGVRISLFVSGCRRGCKGCFNQEAWDFNYGQEFTYKTITEISSTLENPNITGLSILGGDPFEPENREAVTYLLDYVKMFYPYKDVWVWTGYLYEDIKNLEVMQYIDVLVDGPFINDLKDLRLKWRGSSNQRIIDIKKSRESGEVILIA